MDGVWIGNTISFYYNPHSCLTMVISIVNHPHVSTYIVAIMSLTYLHKYIVTTSITYLLMNYTYPLTKVVTPMWCEVEIGGVYMIASKLSSRWTHLWFIYNWALRGFQPIVHRWVLGHMTGWWGGGCWFSLAISCWFGLFGWLSVVIC